MNARFLHRRVPLAISMLSVTALLLTCCGTAAAAAANRASKTSVIQVSASLTGTWSGHYSGAFSGTFRLVWTQTGAKLRGTIRLVPGGTARVTGKVSGTTITFGAVGGGNVITYTGSASGTSMSGRYKTPNGGGSWRARKTS